MTTSATGKSVGRGNSVTHLPPNILTDNGSPSLYALRTFFVTVSGTNHPPTVNIGGTITTTDTLMDFENNEPGTSAGSGMFRNLSFSSTASGFLDLSTDAPDLTAIETAFPDPDINISAKALHVSWSFKAGTTNPWLRLTTFATSSPFDLPNPTVNFSQRLRFDIWTDRPLKVGLGLRETGTGAPLGGDGGTTGTLEWIGVPTRNGSAPNPSRAVSAANWTTLEFDLASDVVLGALGSGNGVLSSATGKGVLEHLALVPDDAGTAYWIDVSGNLTDWTPVTNVVTQTGEIDFTDVNSRGQRFYRARWSP